MFRRLSTVIGRKLLSPPAGFQKITQCQFSRLARNSINRCLEKDIIFNNHKHSRVYGIYLVRYESTVNVAGKETVSNTPSAQPQDIVNINNAVPEEDLLSKIPEPPVPLTEETVEAIMLHANGEPTFQSLGLGGYGPIGLIQWYFEWMHISCGIPWWETIAITAFIIKVVTFPLAINAQKNAVKMQNALPQLMDLQEKMSEAKKSGNAEEAALRAYDLQMFLKKSNIKLASASVIIRLVAHIPVFIALRGMTHVPVESLKTGGLWWFADLTTTDPYYILPLCTSVTTFLVTENAMKNVTPAQMTVAFRTFLRAIPAVSFLFTANFPGVILCYWVCANFLTITQNEALKLDSAKRMFDIPPSIQHPPSVKSPQKATKNFKQAFSDSWSNIKQSQKLADYARADMIQFNEAAKGPLKKTFKYNPLKDVPKKKSMTSMSALKK